MMSLLLCAALETFLAPPALPAETTCVRLTLDCETLTPPVLVFFEAYSCAGAFVDWTAMKGCPPDELRWCPNYSGPLLIEAFVYSGRDPTPVKYSNSNCP